MYVHGSPPWQPVRLEQFVITVAEAVDILCNTYQDLFLVARGLEVDQEELAEAMEAVEPDTAEEVAMKLLKR